jgi:Zn-dependent protease
MELAVARHAALLCGMLDWSMNLFPIRGIPLTVHFSFFLLLAYVGWTGWTEAGMTGVGWSVATVTAFFVCVVLHELGHSFMAQRYGIGVRRILLMPIGGMAEMDGIPRQPGRELLITLAGPAVNFVIAALLWPVVGLLPEVIYYHSWQGLLFQVFLANLIMGTFNLVPVFPMDGGRILRALLATRLPYLKATAIAAMLGKVLSLAGILFMLAWFESPHWLGALLFLFIFMAGDAEYRAVRRRELEDAHWRAMLQRLYGPPPADPPVLR